MTKDLELQDKVILITGASRGIGKATAKLLAKHGATIILLARTVSELEKVYDEITALKLAKPAIYPFNLCSATLEDYDDLRCKLDAHYGKLDGLILNAGILGSLSPIAHYNITTWYQVLQVNLNSSFILTQACLPLLLKSEHANIVFTTPDVATNPRVHWGAYAVAGSGIDTFATILAAEFADHDNLNIHKITPQKVDTALRSAAYPAEDFSSRTTPESIAAKYLQLFAAVTEPIS